MTAPFELSTLELRAVRRLLDANIDFLNDECAYGDLQQDMAMERAIAVSLRNRILDEINRRDATRIAAE